MSKRYNVKKQPRNVQQSSQRVEPEIPKGIQNILTAMKLIADKPGGNGIIDCPECGKKLFWRRAKVNGHVWGKCETIDCLSWIQ